MTREPVDVLRFQQGAGHSTGPKVDVASAVFAAGTPDGDVGELHAATRPQHAVKLAEDVVLVGGEVDHASSPTTFDCMTASSESLPSRHTVEAGSITLVIQEFKR